MAGNPNQKLKLLYIADYLKKYSDAAHPASTDDIIRFLKEKDISSERKSVYNDIEVLKKYGLDIKHSRSGSRGYYIESCCFDDAERTMLINALRTSPILSRGKTAALINKFKKLSGDAVFGEVSNAVTDTGLSDILGTVKSENDEIYQNIDCISRAVAEQKMISFIYRRRHLAGNLPVFDAGRELILSPYAVILNDNKFYVVGNIQKYDDLSHYRVDRMKMVTVLDEPTRPFSELNGSGNKFDASAYSSGLFNMYSGGKEMNVRLTCKDTLLEEMVERFGVNIQYKQLPNGFFTLRTKVRVSEGFIYWLLGFGGDVTVDEPTELCKEIKHRLKNMLKQYE